MFLLPVKSPPGRRGADAGQGQQLSGVAAVERQVDDRALLHDLGDRVLLGFHLDALAVTSTVSVTAPICMTTFCVTSEATWKVIPVCR